MNNDHLSASYIDNLEMGIKQSTLIGVISRLCN